MEIKHSSTTKLYWRQRVEDSQYTQQELEFAAWLESERIPFHHEQLRLIKESHKQKKRVKRRLHKVPDFVFRQLDTEEEPGYFMIELTDRKRPSSRRARPQQADPKKDTRHLARLAHILCGVIYRDEFPQFRDLFQRTALAQPPAQISKIELLRQTIELWNQQEWER